jgi:hypothetical protein
MPERWSRVVLNLFGILHSLFAAYGFYLVVSVMVGFAAEGQMPPQDSQVPYLLESFVVMTAMNLAFIVVLLFAGISLIHSRTAAIRLSNWLFLLMIVYEAALLFRGWVLPVGETISAGIAAAYGVGNIGLAPQVLTGYPIIALIGLNLTKRRMEKKGEGYQVQGSKA